MGVSSPKPSGSKNLPSVAFLFPREFSPNSRQRYGVVPYSWNPLPFFSTWFHLGSPARIPEDISSMTQECVPLGELEHLLGRREASLSPRPTTTNSSLYQSFPEEGAYPPPTPGAFPHHSGMPPIQPGMTLDSSVGFCRTRTNQGSQLLYCEEVHCIAGHAPKPGLLLHQSVHVPPRGRGRPLVPLECLKLACLRQAESDETTPRSSKGSWQLCRAPGWLLELSATQRCAGELGSSREETPAAQDSHPS